MVYYNIRVYDEDQVDLLPYWDQACRFIEKARYIYTRVLFIWNRTVLLWRPQKSIFQSFLLILPVDI